MTGERDNTVSWLLDSDPAIRWQVMRDLQHEGPDVYERERQEVARSGWGQHLLSHQSHDGLWGGSLYNGKWTSTTYSLYLLKLLGLAPGDPQALLGCTRLIEGGLCEGREIRFSRGQTITDLGVTALVVSIASYFGWPGEELAGIAEYLAERQRSDGSWLPNDAGSSSDYAFETTLLVVEALMQFERANGRLGTVSAARGRGWQSLLAHDLGLGAGVLLKPAWASFSFPPYWFYDYLTALDCLRDSDGERDPGAQRAISLVTDRRTREGRWGRGATHAGRTYFNMESGGRLSRWNTLRAMRVLEWWGEPEPRSA